MNSGYKLIKINDFKIKNINLGKQKKILHKDLFNFPYFSCLVCGASGTGKTYLIYNILEYLSYCDDTKIIIISTTTESDKVMMKLIKDFEKYNEVIVHEDLDENVFKEILDEISQNEEHDKFCYAKTIIIFDDIDQESLRMKELYNLIKKVRHYKSHIFILSQYYKDITPASRNQLRYLLLLPGWSPEQVKEIHKLYITDTPYDEFQDIYNKATRNVTGKEDDNHNFLYVSLKSKEYRKNLNEKFIKS